MDAVVMDKANVADSMDASAFDPEDIDGAPFSSETFLDSGLDSGFLDLDLLMIN